MLKRLTPKQYAALLYLTSGAIVGTALLLPTLLLYIAVACALLPFSISFFFEVTALSGGLLLFCWVLPHLRRASVAAGQRFAQRRLREQQLAEQQQYTLFAGTVRK